MIPDATPIIIGRRACLFKDGEHEIRRQLQGGSRKEDSYLMKKLEQMKTSTITFSVGSNKKGKFNSPMSRSQSQSDHSKYILQ